MTHLLKGLLLGTCIALTTGRATGNAESFTFTTDMPSNFTYEAVAEYVPAKGENCTVKKPDVGYNQRWRLDREKIYTPNTEIPIYRTSDGCPLVISRFEFNIYATYGNGYADFSRATGVIVIRETLKEETKGTFDESGLSIFNGQCEWSFRTMGKPRILRKTLNCKSVDAQGLTAKWRPSGAYTLDQLPGKTVKLKIKLADEERPGWGDTWVKVPNGWKRCLGKGMEDQRGYCSGNYKDFSTFMMPDGRSCTVYPGCTE